MPKKPSKSNTLPIFLLNGPNTNTLGSREPEIYGTATLSQIEKSATARAAEHGYALVAMQSNHEGELVGFIQEARTAASAVIINAAAYTHTSIAILDALRLLSVPVIEVHLSNPQARESYRHTSYVAMGATGSITGIGPFGYLLAVDAAAELLKDKKGKSK
jgi:3-dehydroquinate dehydratase-2